MKFTKTFILVNLIAFSVYYASSQNQTGETTVPFNKIGILKTKTTHEIKASNWSVGGETMDRNYTIYKEWSPYLEELGIKKVRLQGGWAKCETSKGVYNWKWMDDVIYDLPKKGIEPWVCLCYGNPLYGKGDIVLGSKIDTDEITRTAWLKWVEAFVTRYKDVVDEWEIWNEPNGHNPPDVYAALLMETSELIKKIQPESKVIGLSLAGIPHDWAESVLQIVKENNKINLVDYLCYHPYNFNPDASYPDVEKLFTIMKKYAPKMELFQGENGAPSAYRNTKALSKYEWTELTQAKWALRRMLGDLSRDIPTSIFSIIDLKYPDEMNMKGLLYSNEDQTVGHRKQSYFAIQNMASVFDNSLERIKDFEYSAKTRHKNSVFAYTNKSNKQCIVTVWLHTNRPTDYNATTPVEVEMKGVKFTNPVWVDLRNGNVYEIPKKEWSQSGKTFKMNGLPVYDSPVLIAEKELIELK